MSMICCSFCLHVNGGIDTIIHIVVSKKNKNLYLSPLLYWKVEAELNMQNINTLYIYWGQQSRFEIWP